MPITRRYKTTFRRRRSGLRRPIGIPSRRRVYTNRRKYRRR